MEAGPLQMESKMSDDINDLLAQPIVPGHPLYAPGVAGRILTDTLIEAGIPPVRADRVAQAMVARLAQHDPPILFGTPDEFSQ